MWHGTEEADRRLIFRSILVGRRILFQSGFRAILARHSRFISIAVIGLSGLVLAVGVIGTFDYYTWLGAPGRLWLWLIWGLWGAMYQSA